MLKSCLHKDLIVEQPLEKSGRSLRGLMAASLLVLSCFDKNLKIDVSKIVWKWARNCHKLSISLKISLRLRYRLKFVKIIENLNHNRLKSFQHLHQCSVNSKNAYGAKKSMLKSYVSSNCVNFCSEDSRESGKGLQSIDNK